MVSHAFNVTGLNVLRQDYNPADKDDYTTSSFKLFDQRWDNSEKIVLLKGVKLSDFQKNMSMEEFFERFYVTYRRKK